jgi:hypothetical protein
MMGIHQDRFSVPSADQIMGVEKSCGRDGLKLVNRILNTLTRREDRCGVLELPDMLTSSET